MLRGTFTNGDARLRKRKYEPCEFVIWERPSVDARARETTNKLALWSRSEAKYAGVLLLLRPVAGEKRRGHRKH